MSMIDKKGWINTNPRKSYLSKREFLGDDYYKWCLKHYEEARVYLKNCGRPKDDFDKWLAAEAGWASKYFKNAISDD